MDGERELRGFGTAMVCVARIDLSGWDMLWSQAMTWLVELGARLEGWHLHHAVASCSVEMYEQVWNSIGQQRDQVDWKTCLWFAAELEDLALVIRVEQDAGDALTQWDYRSAVREATEETLPYLLGKLDDEKEEALEGALVAASHGGHTEKARVILGELEHCNVDALNDAIKEARNYGFGDIVDLLEERVRIFGDMQRGD